MLRYIFSHDASHKPMSDCDSQKVKDNKAEMLALATYVHEVTSQLFAGLLSLNGDDTLNPSIHHYVE
jgi:hypothetical protein